MREERNGPRRGLRRDDAAAYVGVSPSKFDQLVADGRMPKPKRVDGCVIWDRRRLDAAFDDLPGDEERDSLSQWDDIAA
jgi:predicted DNA-binding transcriptional regulator AlpA